MIGRWSQSAWELASEKQCDIVTRFLMNLSIKSCPSGKRSAKAMKVIFPLICLFLIIFFYKQLDYTEQYLCPQQNTIININKKNSIKITCTGEWIKHKYGSPYEFLISINNISKNDNVKLMQFSLILPDTEINIPANRISCEYREKMHEVTFFCKYLFIDFSSTEKIKYKITLDINNKQIKKVIDAKIDNYKTRSCRQ